MYPVVGNMLEVVFLNSAQLFEFLRKNAAKYKKAYRFCVFGKVHINILRAPEMEVSLNTLDSPGLFLTKGTSDMGQS